VENAHLRMGRLTFVRQTKDSITNVTLHLDRLVAEVSTEAYSAGNLHFVSVFGSDQEVGAIAAAAADGQQFQIAALGTEFLGTIGEKPTIYRGSLQLRGRKRPLRHLVAISKELVETTFGANAQARRTILYDSSPDFLLHRLSVRFGLPVLPGWAGWFHAELVRRRLIEELRGLNCSPIAVKGTKMQMLRILSQGLRRKAIEIPNSSIVSQPPSVV
jgi:hypothetical protein